MPERKEQLVELLKLEPHPEGGFYKEVYRSEESINYDSGQFPDGRNYCTSIYYLLGSDDISRFHRIKSDETWHHYEGSSVTIHIIHEDGLYEALYLGKNLENNQFPQQTVPAGAWFGVTVDTPDSFALCGCTVSPGFDFQDFQMADRYMMLQAFPEHEAIIKKLLP